MNSPLTIIQITDLHILAEQGKTMSGVDTEQSFKQLLKHIHSKHKKIDLLLVTGDLAEDPCEASYQRIFQALNKYPTRTACLPGNHDNFSLMQQFISGQQINCDKHLQFKHWQVINLNSKKTGSQGGYLAASELNFLTDTLKNNKPLNTLIAVHHHPVATHSRWMDTMMIENSAELLSLIKDYPQVKAITCGHIHQELQTIKKGKLIFGTPSSCFQFKPLSSEYAIDNNQTGAGYRVFSLDSEGQIETKVYRPNN